MVSFCILKLVQPTSIGSPLGPGSFAPLTAQLLVGILAWSLVVGLVALFYLCCWVLNAFVGLVNFR